VGHGFWRLWDQVFRGRQVDALEPDAAETGGRALTLADLAWRPDPGGGTQSASPDGAARAIAHDEGGGPPDAVGRPPLPTPTFRRIVPSLPRARITSVVFPKGAVTSIFESKSRTAAQRPRRAAARRPPPPPGAPLKDRLQAVLQPPLDFVLGDNRLYVPMAPFEYQYEGIGFLAGRWSAILADEMGLGKTMQSIMAIRLLLRAGMIESVLLVCPKPLVSNWLREFSVWAEEIPVAAIRGDGEARRTFWIYDRSPVKIANYESLARDEQIVRDPSTSFDLVLLDEAQRIKNRESKTARVVHAVRRKRSWALTGTPVENRPEDLVSLLEFVSNAGRRGALAGPPPTTAELRGAVAEVILRRTKEMVLNDLPQRVTRDVYVDLGPDQRRTYEQAEREGVVRLDDLGASVAIEHVFKLIGQLKQICNFDPATGESAKTDLLRGDLEEVAASGKKAIVFSQYVRTLEELAGRLAERRPLLYHGGVAPRERERVLQEFRERADRPVLLLSYGTGAVGLNLQFANYVFLFDRWWNPAVEDQAINRAHRIGQKDRVFVTRYVCPDTIESRIAQVLEQKRELFTSLIDGHEPSERDLGMSADEIFGLFDLKVRGRRAA
jgi:SNF2 family DNA or RNA helicase